MSVDRKSSSKPTTERTIKVLFGITVDNELIKRATHPINKTSIINCVVQRPYLGLVVSHHKGWHLLDDRAY